MRPSRDEYTYEKKVCNLCSQVCYNKNDLDFHIKNEHSINENNRTEQQSSFVRA
jgi:hypothetical protein